jgi:hypothetical protein
MVAPVYASGGRRDGYAVSGMHNVPLALTIIHLCAFSPVYLGSSLPPLRSRRYPEQPTSPLHLRRCRRACRHPEDLQHLQASTPAQGCGIRVGLEYVVLTIKEIQNTFPVTVRHAESMGGDRVGTLLAPFLGHQAYRVSERRFRALYPSPSSSHSFEVYSWVSSMRSLRSMWVLLLAGIEQYLDVLFEFSGVFR